MKILGIETSCDETAAAVVEVVANKITVLSNVISSQIEIHKKYGGVIPEVAAREHVLNILPVINEAMAQAKIIPTSTNSQINAIAVTVGPGLITSLISGVETAKTLACTWGVPIIGINHIEGHIYANFIDQNFNIKFPALILTVSGGHTILALMAKHGKIKIIGDTLDDAAGEAFDKAAKLLNIGYPGGPAIAQAASDQDKNKDSDFKISLPRPMIEKANLNFSFSGLKTALLYALQKDKNYLSHVPAYANEFQQAVIDVLVYKTIKAAEKYNANTVMLAGGVSANHELRHQLEKAVAKKLVGSIYHIPDLAYTTDNAVMIAAAGYFKAKQKKFTRWNKLKADPNLSL